jgi:ABC-type antimicrobial peptide transport system permease subunit
MSKAHRFGDAVAAAIVRLRSARGRSLLAAVGVAAASLMVGTAVAISFGLATGFDRAADRADLPDVIARFNDADREDVESRVDSLPNLDSTSFAAERNDLGIEQFDTDHNISRTIVSAVADGARRGYAVLEGSDLSGGPGEILVEEGLAEDWDLSVGDQIYVDTLGPLTIRGIVLAPDDVAYPLASRARVWVSQSQVSELFVGNRGDTVNVAQIWAQDPDQLDELLVQARAVSFGLENLRFVTVEGIRSLVGQAAGIVIALLIAFSLVAVGAAGIALGATARADVQRHLASIGAMRAVGLSRGSVAGRYALDAGLVAVPSALVGLLLGALVAYGPSSRLLGILNELAPGAALIPVLGACLLAIVAVVVGATVWPAWRAAGLLPARTLRGATLPATARRSRMPSGPFGLGLRLAATRRGRTLTTAAVVGAATSVVLLMLALASFLQSLQDDPGAIGKRFEISADAPAGGAAAVAALPGVERAAPRYELDGLDSFRLGETVDVIAYPGDHTEFEAPPLAEGRRLATAGEAEVGQGLADSLGLETGGTLAVQLPDGGEARFTVTGIVRAIDNEGRVAYVRPSRLLAAGGDIEPSIAVKLTDGADPAVVSEELRGIGADPSDAAGATTRDQAFLGVLAGVLRVVAGVNGLICLFILVQSLAVTAAERRQALAVLRAAGAGRRAVTLVLAGTASAVLVVAIPLGIVLERFALGPLVSHLAAGYAPPVLATPVSQVAIAAALLAILALIAAARVARTSERASIPAELRGA